MQYIIIAHTLRFVKSFREFFARFFHIILFIKRGSAIFELHCRVIFGNIGILFIQIQLHAVLYDLGGVSCRLRAGEIYTKLLTNNIADHIVNLGFDVDIG